MGNEKPTVLEKAIGFAERLKDSTKTVDTDYANTMAKELSSIIWEAKLAYPAKKELRHLFDEQRMFTTTHSKNPGVLFKNVKDSTKELLNIINK